MDTEKKIEIIINGIEKSSYGIRLQTNLTNEEIVAKMHTALMQTIPIKPPVKPATAEEIIKILNKAAEEINVGQSTTYDGFDITKDRKNFIAKIRKHIRKQLSV